MTTPDNFDGAVDYWLRTLNEPWNRLRYTIYQTNIQRHIPNRPLNILDAGGGSGEDSMPFAHEGHQVTYIDYSSKMVEATRSHVNASGVADRVTILQGDVHELPELYPEPVFDLVMCHNVIQYSDNLRKTLAAVVAPLKPGGWLSLISVNRYSDTMQAALLHQNLDKAFSQIETHEAYHPEFGTRMHRYAAWELMAPLEAAGCDLLGHYGVRCVMDYVADNDLKNDPKFYADLERLELELTDKHPYKLLARLFQIICKKHVD